MTDVGANYRKIIDRSREAAVRCGREAHSIKLLAAAKTQSIEAIRAAVIYGRDRSGVHERADLLTGKLVRDPNDPFDVSVLADPSNVTHVFKGGVQYKG